MRDPLARSSHRPSVACPHAPASGGRRPRRRAGGLARSAAWAASLATALLAVSLAVPLAAQSPLAGDPGHFPLERLGLLSPDELSLEINLQGAMLSMLSAFLGTDEPELAEVMSGLRGVTVRSAELSGGRLEEVRAGMGGAVDWLDANGWMPIVRVREPEEEVYIYLKGDGDVMDGLAILAVDSYEATIVNLIGSIDLARLAVIVDGFDLPASAALDGEEEGGGR